MLAALALTMTSCAGEPAAYVKPRGKCFVVSLESYQNVHDVVAEAGPFCGAQAEHVVRWLKDESLSLITEEK